MGFLKRYVFCICELPDIEKENLQRDDVWQCDNCKKVYRVGIYSRFKGTEILTWYLEV